MAQNQGTLFASSFELQTLQDLVPVDYFPANLVVHAYLYQTASSHFLKNQLGRMQKMMLCGVPQATLTDSDVLYWPSSFKRMKKTHSQALLRGVIMLGCSLFLGATCTIYKMVYDLPSKTICKQPSIASL